MGDMGDYFNDLRAIGQEKRASNRERSTALLLERGISFTSRNGGAHLIVNHGGKVVDFWPGTGKWIVRGGAARRGVFPLLKVIEGEG